MLLHEFPVAFSVPVVDDPFINQRLKFSSGAISDRFHRLTLTRVRVPLDLDLFFNVLFRTLTLDIIDYSISTHVAGVSTIFAVLDSIVITIRYMIPTIAQV